MPANRSLIPLLAAIGLLLSTTVVLKGCGTAPAQNTQPTPTRFEYATLAMGTRARVVLYADTEPRAAAMARAAFDEIERLEQIMSDYRPSSEASEFTRAEAGVWVPVSPDLIRILQKSQASTELTDGAFSITLGPVVGLWREARNSGTAPSEQRLAEAAILSDPVLLSLNTEQSLAMISRPGVTLDFGGIGKGLAAHAARDTIQSLGSRSVLVDLGGDLALGDPPPGTRGWTVRVETGINAARDTVLHNTCIATSGDAEQAYAIDGRRYSHIIDPRTSRPLSTPRAATVIHPDGATADALASAACVLGHAGLDRLHERSPRARITLVEATTQRPNPVPAP